MIVGVASNHHIHTRQEGGKEEEEMRSDLKGITLTEGDARHEAEKLAMGIQV